MIVQLDEPLWVGLGLVVGLNPQYSHPVCMTTKLEHSCNNQQFPGYHGNVSSRNFLHMEKCAWEIS